jgi:hypothetical protein
MNIVCLQIFVPDASRHHGKVTYEWLLEQRRGLVASNSAFRAGRFRPPRPATRASSVAMIAGGGRSSSDDGRPPAGYSRGGLHLVYAKLPKSASPPRLLKPFCSSPRWRPISFRPCPAAAPD